MHLFSCYELLYRVWEADHFSYETYLVGEYQSRKEAKAVLRAHRKSAIDYGGLIECEFEVIFRKIEK
jgi:hypothetical protein